MRLLATISTGIALALLAPALAQADVFGPISLASVSALPGFSLNQQADYAHDAALSGNGRYVAFDGSFAGRTGVWRRDLQTGVVEAVAAENEAEPSISAPDADLPSISENGQYVSFSTTARLDPVDDTNRGPDVYVRDMDIPASVECEPGPDTVQPCAYTLVSAVDGSNAGLTYEQPGPDSAEHEEESFGSVAAGRSAISADGRKVVFVTTAPSNLVGAATPRLQVAVRELNSEHTELVSVARDSGTGNPISGQPVSGREGSEVFGAVYIGAILPPAFKDPEPYEPLHPAVGASISADGTTIAWMGVDISQQVQMLPGEVVKDSYTEPLWRRIGGGPTRRITGGSDPSSPGCAASGEQILPANPSSSDPCQGPFRAQEGGAGVWTAEHGANFIPRLSADGYEVAFLADAPLVSLGEDFGVSEHRADLYLVDMHEGLTRTQALRPLTELAGADAADIAEDGPVEDFDISPSGDDVAFTTKRTVFPLGTPAYISPPMAAPLMLELFDVDLADDTLTRVTQGFEGGPAEHPHPELTTGEDPYTNLDDGALSPSLSSDGNELAFSSTASNLVFGDGNTPPLGSVRVDGSDAFVVSRVLFSPLPTQQSISSAPAAPAIVPKWRIGVTSRSRADGSVLLYVSIPGAGAVSAGAQSGVRVHTRSHGHVHTSVATRMVATARKTSHASGAALLTITLTPGSRYRSLASKRPGLAATVNVSFAAPHHSTLRQSVLVSFLRTEKAKPKQKSTKKKSAKKKTAKQSRRPAGPTGGAV
jgi:Tol biopolymer transport system component